ncbi:hypothetical protein PENANT_c047G00889 [Penicillium antarcticum]|uniref:Sulfotransferase domain-containing protein n=1 Tax=Penicillium antarcticum TaxID=416450 RepID=A0A1V6PSE3_9EURO|nr:uncharacterized protein N7508_005020 [Penicillium antarcticum]KAJ5306005.1 hypothetical protein N7508_005020 [Penicillium antarcticum]OQD79627.1 hypothetical protein PENANT_c047G00889 [Penicillium antarcticum]
MSRKVDQLPMPVEVRRMKVIVASPSRSGTLGLYQAMKILGFKTYHLYECIAVNGLPHLQAMKEAIIAQYNRIAGVKKFNQTDYDRWLGEYDCLVEIPSYMGMDLIGEYLKDPEVKFILTERDPDKWVNSVNNTAGGVAKMGYEFPFSILKYFDATLYDFLDLNDLVYKALSGCTEMGDPDNRENLRQYYTDYINLAKATIPADRLCLIQLEDGLDWEKICPFLDLPIPDVAYPNRNEPEKFQVMVEEFLQPKIIASVMRLSAVAIPVVGVLGWAAVKYARFFVA